MTIKTILFSTAILATLAGAGTVASQSVSADDGGGQYRVASSDATTGYIASYATGDVWSKPYGQDGAQWLANFDNLKRKTVKVYQSYQDTGNKNLTWYQIDLGNGQRGWIDGKNFWNNPDVQSNVSATYAKITTKHSYDNAFSATSAYAAGNDSAIVAPLSQYEGQTVAINNTFTDNNGTKWATVTLNGSQFIVANDTLSPISDKLLSDVASKYVNLDSTWSVAINKAQSGDVWDRPYGLKGANWIRSNQSLPSGNIRVDKIMTTSTGNWVHLQNIGWVDSNVCTWNGGNAIDTNSTAYNRYGFISYAWQNHRSPFSGKYDTKTGYTPSTDLSKYFNDGAWHPAF